MKETSLVCVRFVINIDFWIRETSLIDQSSQSNLLLKSSENLFSVVGFFIVADLESQVKTQFDDREANSKILQLPQI